jgi:hypothetical protein
MPTLRTSSISSGVRRLAGLLVACVLASGCGTRSVPDPGSPEAYAVKGVADLTVFLAEDTPPSEVLELSRRLSEAEGVSCVVTKTPDEARKDFEGEFGTSLPDAAWVVKIALAPSLPFAERRATSATLAKSIEDTHSISVNVERIAIGTDLFSAGDWISPVCEPAA